MFRDYSTATTQSMPPPSCPFFAFHSFIYCVGTRRLGWMVRSSSIGWAYLLWRIREHRHSTEYEDRK